MVPHQRIYWKASCYSFSQVLPTYQQDPKPRKGITKGDLDPYLEKHHMLSLR